MYLFVIRKFFLFLEGWLGQMRCFDFVPSLAFIYFVKTLTFSNLHLSGSGAAFLDSSSEFV